MVDDSSAAREPRGSSATAVTRSDAQQTAPPTVSARLAGRPRQVLTADGDVQATAPTSPLDQARAHARAQAEASQAAARLSRGRHLEDTDYEPSSAALAQAQALAAAEAAAAQRPRELRPQPARPRDRLLGMHVLQVVALEIGLLVIAALGRERLAILIPCVLAALVVIVLAVGRYRGRWLYEWLFLRLRYWTRQRSHQLNESPERAAAPFARGVVLDQIDLDGVPVGVLKHAGGFVAVVEPRTDESTGGTTVAAQLPPLGDMLPASTENAPQVSLQVLVHTVPAPGLTSVDDAAATSYAELAGGAIPVQRRALIAIQAQHTVGSFIAADLEGALVNALRRIRRKLDKAGFIVNTLSRAELGREFGEASASELTVDDAPIEPVREAWRSWHAGSTRHVTYRIVGWPNLADETGARLIEHISSAPTLDTTVSLAARNVAGQVEIEAAVRLRGESDVAHETVRTALTEVVERCGATLQRLDGQHGFGMAASVPLGGFAS